MIVENNSEQRWETLFILQINIMAESGIQVKGLKEYTVAVEVNKVVTLQINIVAESGIQVKLLR